MNLNRISSTRDDMARAVAYKMRQDIDAGKSDDDIANNLIQLIRNTVMSTPMRIAASQLCNNNMDISDDIVQTALDASALGQHS